MSTVREATGPQLSPLGDDDHLLRPLFEWAERNPERVLASVRAGDMFVPVTAAVVVSRVRGLARGLIAKGVTPGDRVAVMAKSSLEWMLADYAILAAGAVTVPIYDTSSLEQVQWILSDSGAVLAIVQTEAMRAMCAQVTAAAPACREVIVLEGGGLDHVTEAGAEVSDADVDERVAGVSTASLATIIYTSGTTGRPKGCMLTHGNLRTNVRQNIDALGPMLGENEVSLLFLPLAHTLAKIILLVLVERGYECAFATDAGHVVEELPMARPTMVVSVPRIFERVFNAAQHKAHAEGKGAIFDKAADVAIEWSRERTELHPHLLTRVEHGVFDKLVYSKIRAVFGGQLRFAFSGGGPLGERLTHFFNGIGVRIFEGYGLTETSPTLTVNRADAWKPGTVGTPLAGTTIRIADDGEILAKGPQVFSGYWHNDHATAETFDDEGWFLTGDIGQLDDGFVRITGRKKELIVTAGGKNVAPAPLEDRLRAHPLISQAVVVGDARPFIAALVTLDPDGLAEWAADHDLDRATQDLAHHPDLVATVQEAVDAANLSVSRAESIRRFAILPNDLTIEAGELTPTLKVRRATVEKTYADAIDSLYP